MPVDRAALHALAENAMPGMIVTLEPSTVLALLARLDEAEGLLDEVLPFIGWESSGTHLLVGKVTAFLAPSTPTEAE